jgi:hypothetical protein
MSDPRHRVDRTVPAPPEAVLAAIRAAIPATRTSHIPPELRRHLIPTLRGSVRGDRFTLGLDQRHEGDTADLAGQVVAAEGGGSRVRASVDAGRGTPALLLGGLVLAVVLLATGRAEVGTVLLLLAFVAAAAAPRGSANPAEAAFLVSWLNGVLDGLAADPPGPAPVQPKGEPPPAG